MNPRHPAAIHQQRRAWRHASSADAYAFFNLLTAPELFDRIESLLPVHRERLFPPAETLSMFMAQALSADRSCQRAVNDLAVKKVEALQHSHWRLLSCSSEIAGGDGFQPGSRGWQSDQHLLCSDWSVDGQTGSAGGWDDSGDA